MAKVQTCKLYLELDGKHQYFTRVINYNNSDHSFSITLPTAMAKTLGKEELSAKTQQEVEDAWKAAMDEYKEAKIEYNKVILFDIKLRSSTRDDHGDGLMIDIWAAVYEERIATSGGGRIYRTYNQLESSLDFPRSTFSRRIAYRGERHEKQIPWTQKNEDFFLFIQTKMQDLIEQLGTLIKPDDMLSFIQSGRLLSMGKGKANGE